MKVLNQVAKIVAKTCLTLGVSSSLIFSVALAEPKLFAQEVADSIKATEQTHQKSERFQKSFAIRANSAFIFPPAQGCELNSDGKAEVGVIMVHDLYESPYMMQHLARELSKRCALVYGVRLAGHGTKISDLETVTEDDWHQQLKVAHHEMQQKSANVVFIGSGLGAHLGLTLALSDPTNFAALAVTSTSVADCSRKKRNRSHNSNQWRQVEDEVANQLVLDDDLVKYTETNTNARYQAQLALNTLCGLVKNGKRLAAPSLFIFGDRSFDLNKHDLHHLRGNDAELQILYFHNSKMNQKKNIQLSNLKLVTQERTAEEQVMFLVPDEYLLIPEYDTWYGKKPNYLRCKLATDRRTKLIFCRDDLPELPTLTVSRGGQFFQVYFQSFNHGFQRLLNEVNALINKFFIINQQNL